MPRMIVERTLLFTPAGTCRQISLRAALWAPTERLAGNGLAPMSYCKVETQDDSGKFAEEVTGVDHFQALAFALFHLAAFFARYAAMGQLTWSEGGQYHPEQDLILSVRSDAIREQIAKLAEANQQKGRSDPGSTLGR